MIGADSGSGPGPAHTVSDPRLAALLTDPVARRFYEPFLDRTISVKAAADEVGCSLDAMLYRVRVFVRAGLLTVVEERPRHGRAIKLYRTVFPVYFVPHRVTPFTTVEDQLYLNAEPTLRRWATAAARRLHAGDVLGTRLYRDHFGEVWSVSAQNASSLGRLDTDLLNDPARPPNFDVVATLHLNEAQALDLQTALVQLLNAWRPYSAPGSGESFSLSIFFHSQTR